MTIGPDGAWVVSPSTGSVRTLKLSPAGDSTGWTLTRELMAAATAYDASSGSKSWARP